MNLIMEIVVSALLVAGGIFALVGSIGLLRLSTLMKRLHAPTKATTLGVGGCLLASIVYFAFFEGHLTYHELLITLFLFLTAPVTANMIAKAYIHTAPGVASELPPTGTAEGWATLDAAPASDEADRVREQ